MPVSIQRLNARRSQPNANIIFIKPLPGPDSATSQNFLERIAAQCLPIMKQHHISVVTLEEHEPNREFVGRNFNAGEVVQLVLRSARAPHRWLPFRYVQMVMMHELAHCAQMNHSRAFWAVRDAYASEMTALWARGYTGEGIWGRGAALGDGAWERNTVKAEEEPLPEHLCGGTYRSRRRKRRPKVSWREQRDRRIAKKFGTAGTALGADEVQKTKLEGGKKLPGRPRVAGSGRRGGGESGSDYEEEDEVDAVDWDGKKITDREGRAMVKVCGDEKEGEQDPVAARSERDELRRVLARPTAVVKAEEGNVFRSRVKDEPKEDAGTVLREQRDPPSVASSSTRQPLRLHDIPHIRDAVAPHPPAPSKTRTAAPTPRPASAPTKKSAATTTRPTAAITIHRLPATPQPPANKGQGAPTTTTTTSSSRCPLCSLDNGGGTAALRCAACAHVLRPDAVRGAWACGSAECAGTGYVNAGDCGVCGLCGGRKP